MTALLSEAGLYVLHERTRVKLHPEVVGEAPDGTVSAFHAVEGFWRRGEHPVEWDVIVQQTRHPLDVIRSLNSRGGMRIWVWQEKYTGIPHGQKWDDRDITPMERSCRFVLAFEDIMAKRNPVYRYRIEEIEDVWPDLQKILEIEKPFPASVKRRGGNPYKGDRLRYEDLGDYANPIRALSRSYGYAA